jgi:tetratricopeptide (TPR) repeat protein
MAIGASLKLVTLVSALACAALLALSPGAQASGGGGGGGMGGGMSDMGSSGENPQIVYQRALQEMQGHNYSAAIRDLRTVQRAAPNDPNIQFVLGVAYVGANDTRNAKTQFEHAARQHNAPLAVYLQLGLIDLQSGDHDGAVAQQTKLQTMLQACDAQCGDAQHAAIQAQLDAMNQALANAAATPSTTTTTTTTAPAPASSPTTGWNFPNVPEGRAAYAAAVGLINQQRYSEALVQLDRAEAAIGPHPDILNYKGFTSRRLGRIDDALNYYHEALALDPNHRGANEYLGELYLQMGRLSEARAQLAKLDHLCAYGCAEHEELAHFIDLAEANTPVSAR